MSNLTISLASLVKSNNGFFKSEKQASFLLSKKDDLFAKNSISGDTVTVRGNSISMVYTLDDKGVTEVNKYSFKKQTLTKTWERKVSGVKSMNETKQEKNLMRRIKEYEESIKERDEAMQNGEFDGIFMDLYISSNESDLKALKDHRDALNDLRSKI